MALKDNLVAYWKMDGNSNDSVGSNNGTDTSITYGSSYGKINQGALFNGSSSKIITGNCNYGTRFSVSLWAKPASSSQLQYARLIESNVSGGFTINYSTTGSNVWVSAVNGVNAPNIAVSNNAWQHIVLVYNGSTVTIYNNNSAASNNSTTDPTLTNAPINIGEYVGGGNYYFNGSVDEIAIWNRAITATEVAELYNNGNGYEIPLTTTKTYLGFF